MLSKLVDRDEYAGGQHGHQYVIVNQLADKLLDDG